MKREDDTIKIIVKKMGRKKYKDDEN